ncbi:MAG: hypothetical protein Q4F83_12215 [Eubacteriales bacterium]|nr:hypothetical protein [Eubacteriales bacterium]
MGEILNYIFGSMKSTEMALKNINKALRNQSKLNNEVMIFSIAMTTYAVLSERDRRRQEKEIKRLSKEIEGLKHSEGE